jgi:hypothetical protein
MAFPGKFPNLFPEERFDAREGEPAMLGEKTWSFSASSCQPIRKPVSGADAGQQGNSESVPEETPASDAERRLSPTASAMQSHRGSSPSMSSSKELTPPMRPRLWEIWRSWPTGSRYRRNPHLGSRPAVVSGLCRFSPGSGYWLLC